MHVSMMLAQWARTAERWSCHCQSCQRQTELQSCRTGGRSSQI